MAVTPLQYRKYEQKKCPLFCCQSDVGQKYGLGGGKIKQCVRSGPQFTRRTSLWKNSVKPDPATCLKAKCTCTKPIHVVDGLLYLCSTFRWRFVNLSEEFKQAITHVFETPKTQTNVFKQWMTGILLWRMSSGLQLDDSIVELPVSPHYWNTKTLSVRLLEGVNIVDGVSKGVYY